MAIGEKAIMELARVLASIEIGQRAIVEQLKENNRLLEEFLYADEEEESDAKEENPLARVAELKDQLSGMASAAASVTGTASPPTPK